MSDTVPFTPFVPWSSRVPSNVRVVVCVRTPGWVSTSYGAFSPTDADDFIVRELNRGSDVGAYESGTLMYTEWYEPLLPDILEASVYVSGALSECDRADECAARGDEHGVRLAVYYAGLAIGAAVSLWDHAPDGTPDQRLRAKAWIDAASERVWDRVTA